MSKVIVLCVALFASSAYSFEFEGQYQEPSVFESLFQEKYQTPWMQSAHICRAQTVCPTGHRIWCEVYGSQYVANGSLRSSCEWLVLPGRAVRCRGYQQVMTPYGYQWSWVDVPVSCF